MPADQTPAPTPLNDAELDTLEADAEGTREDYLVMAEPDTVLRLVAEVRRLRAASVVPASQSPSLVALPVEDLALCADAMPEAGDRIAWNSDLTEWWSTGYKPEHSAPAAYAGTVIAVPESHMDAVQYVIVRLDKAPAPARPAVELPREAPPELVSAGLMDANGKLTAEGRRLSKAMRELDAACEADDEREAREAPPGTVRVRAAVYHGPYAGGYYLNQLGADEKPGKGCLAILVADVPLPPPPPVVQARVEPAPAKEVEVPRG